MVSGQRNRVGFHAPGRLPDRVSDPNGVVLTEELRDAVRAEVRDRSALVPELENPGVRAGAALAASRQRVQKREGGGAGDIQPEHHDGIAAGIVRAREDEHVALGLPGHRRRRGKNSRCQDTPGAKKLKSLKSRTNHHLYSPRCGRRGMVCKAGCTGRFASAGPLVTLLAVPGSFSNQLSRRCNFFALASEYPWIWTALSRP